MNKIVVLGNGFDLALGLKTSYNDFLMDYWNNIYDKFKNFNSAKYEDENIEIKGALHQYSTNRPDSIKKYNEFIQFMRIENKTMHFKNHFLQVLSESNDLNNWVDIEEMYYRFLIKIKNKNNRIKDGVYTITALNEDFEKIKTLLKAYLKHVKNESKVKLINSLILNDIYELSEINNISSEIKFKVQKEIEEAETKRIEKTLSNERLNMIAKEINDMSNNPNYAIQQKEKLDTAISEKLNTKPETILFLNFNYTGLTKLLVNESKPTINKKIINIHGTLEEDNIIFGFGDELDKEYKEIEESNNNEFLKNVKSINYLQNSAYKELLDFIQTNYYQVCIYGHSCGNSDRTLLNTLFEHKNCLSVKPYYWKKSESEDNYMELVQNISRNFSDKKLFRDRVVNKTYSIGVP